MWGLQIAPTSLAQHERLVANRRDEPFRFRVGMTGRLLNFFVAEPPNSNRSDSNLPTDSVIDALNWLGPLKNFLSNKKAAPSNCVCMPCLYHITMLPAAISVIAFLIGMAGFEAHADETGATFSF